MSEVNASPQSSFDEVKYNQVLKAAQSVAISFNLISQGLYQFNAMNEVKVALDFLDDLYKKIEVELEPMIAEKERIEEAKTQSSVEEAQS